MLSILAGLVSGVGGALASRSAARTQEKAAGRSLALQTRIYDETSERMAPFSDAGRGAIGILEHLLGGADAPEGFDGLDMTPGAQFAMNKGFADVKAAARARGTGDSGATLLALEDYRRGMATTDRNAQIGQLFTLAQLGANATAGQATQGAQFAGTASETMMQGANARAAGTIGMANAFTGGLEQGISLYALQKGLNPTPSARPGTLY